MTYKERKDSEQYLLHLIEKGWLISLEKAAVNFNCSKRTVERMLCDLRGEGHNIEYCAVKKKYFVKN